MVDATGEADRGGLRVDFDARSKLAFHGWSLTSLREKVVKIGAKVIAHARYTVFQMAEVAVPRDLFRRILEMINDLRCRQVERC